MHAEILRIKIGAPRIVELYSYFYVLIMCQVMPTPATTEDQPLSWVMSPWSSMGGSNKLIEENHILHLQVKYKDLLEEN